MNKFSQEDNSTLIKEFVKTQNLQDNYEVWVPFTYRGITGFVDLVIENDSSLSIFKFTKKAKKLKGVAKSLKLETLVYPKSRDKDFDEIQSYLVIADNRRNRKAVFYQYSLLGSQPFDIIFLDKGDGSIESISEMTENIPRLFQTQKMDLEKEALRNLISKPNHEEIERAILDSGDAPEIITGEMVKKVNNYLKKNDEPPENLVNLLDNDQPQHSLETDREGTETEEVEKLEA